MPESLITVPQYECARCGWKWMSRGDQRPVICPHCKTPYWDRARRDATK